MSASRDYVPSRDADFHSWFENLVTYVKQRTLGGSPSWTHIPPAAVEELEAAFEDWRDNYLPTLVPHSRVQTVAKNEARKRAEAVIRPFVQRYLMWSPVTDPDRAAMSLHIKDKILTQQKAPETVPEIGADTSVIRRLRFRLRDSGSRRWAKPDHVETIEFKWAILDERPGHISELVNTETASANPIDLFFEDDQRGKQVYYAARWSNGKSQEGPWSDIESAFIP